MIAKNILQTFGEFAFRFMCKKVNVLIQRHGFPKSERLDLLQEFACNLLAREANFDPAVASWEAFVVVVCENHAATLLEHRRAKKRTRKREDGSLNRRIKDSEGRWTEMGATLCACQHAVSIGRHQRSHEEEFGLVEDMARVLEDMPPRMRNLCEEMRSGKSKAAAAREEKVSQGSLYEYRDRILARFEKAGLRGYLK
jgi:RNA polymerase sigma-70 factor (ECF subfamily)